MDLHSDTGDSVLRRYKKHKKQQKEPPRSKSEYDLSQLQLSITEDESDENNNDTSDEFVTLAKTDVLEGTQRLSLEDNVVAGGRNGGQSDKLTSSSTADASVDAIDGGTTKTAATTPTEGDLPTSPTTPLSCKPHQPKLTVLRSDKNPRDDLTLKLDIVHTKNDTVTVVSDQVIKKPVPLPRKHREKPVPPPRRPSPRTPHAEGSKELFSNTRQVASAPYSLRSAALQSEKLKSDTPKIKPQPPLRSPTEINTEVKKNHSLVESLTQRFTALSATPSVSPGDKPRHTGNSEQEKTPQTGAISPTKTPTTQEKTCTFTATPIFIARSETPARTFQAKPVFISELRGPNLTSGQNGQTSVETPGTGSENLGLGKGRKRCPDVPVSTYAIKRERKSVNSDSTTGSDANAVRSVPSEFVPVEKSNSSSTSKSEMSIESVGQAVYESDINAITTASMEADLMLQGEEDEAREVTRANSSLSGKIEPQDLSPLSASPTAHHSSKVPRSHSDISCRLESQHSRDSSIVSNHSRLSRASVGADLENFFNQMGLEKGVLEPISRLKELQSTEVFDSMSSLDSQDAASICSTYSRSEQEWSDTQSMERSQQQTSIVERNARIIKWLCNVRKAKSPIQADSATAGKA